MLKFEFCSRAQIMCTRIVFLKKKIIEAYASAVVYCTELTQTGRDLNTLEEGVKSSRKHGLICGCFVIHGGNRAG